MYRNIDTNVKMFSIVFVMSENVIYRNKFDDER